MKTKILSTIVLILIMSACGAGRPMPPTIAYTYSASGATRPIGNTNGSMVMLSPYEGLYGATLYWDVTNINGAIGVEIIAATDQSCEKDLIATGIGDIKRDSSGNNTFINLATIFGIQSLPIGQYYICLKVIKANGHKSPASWPAYLIIRYY